MPLARAVNLRCRTLIAGLVSVIALLAFAATSSAAVVGVNPDITWGISSSQVSQEVSLIKQAGITWVRASVDLSGAEYSAPGQLNMNYLNGVDAAIQTARGAGLNVLIEFDRTPYWASADPNKYADSSGYHYNHYYRYTDPQQFAGVVADLVSHYKGMGVHAYELWNEPNNGSFWPSGVNAAEYTSYLKAAYPAVKAADPSAVVAMGGLMNTGSYNFLQGMYNAGARGYFDVANFHLYPSGSPTTCQLDSSGRPSESSFCLLQGLRSEMTANGDSTPAWVTELGWSTCTQSYCATQQEQANYITSAFQLLGGSSYGWVQKVFAYQMRDLYATTSNSTWGSSLGLLNRDFTAKLAFSAVRAIATGSGSTTGSGGTTTNSGPTVSLTSPTSRATIGTSIAAAATARDPAGVTKVTFSIDGKVKATDSSSPYADSIRTRKLANGTHTITATAYDAAGNKATSSVTVRKGAFARTTLARRAGSRARVSLRLSRARLAGRVIVRGRVHCTGAAPRRLVLILQRRRGGRWLTLRIDTTIGGHGAYRHMIHLRHGTWRIRASYRSVTSASRQLRVV